MKQNITTDRCSYVNILWYSYKHLSGLSEKMLDVMLGAFNQAKWGPPCQRSFPKLILSTSQVGIKPTRAAFTCEYRCWHINCPTCPRFFCPEVNLLIFSKTHSSLVIFTLLGLNELCKTLHRTTVRMSQELIVPVLTFFWLADSCCKPLFYIHAHTHIHRTHSLSVVNKK